MLDENLIFEVGEGWASGFHKILIMWRLLKDRGLIVSKVIISVEVKIRETDTRSKIIIKLFECT